MRHRPFCPELLNKGECLKYLISAFPVYWKKTQNLFVYLMVHKLEDEYFIETMSELEKNAWFIIQRRCQEHVNVVYQNCPTTIGELNLNPLQNSFSGQYMSILCFVSKDKARVKRVYSQIYSNLHVLVYHISSRNRIHPELLSLFLSNIAYRLDNSLGCWRF